MTHTPTPWDVDIMGYLRGPSNENILEVKENAAFIVKAVNCHEELLAACKSILWWINQEKVPYLMDTDDNPGEKIRQALAKVEAL